MLRLSCAFILPWRESLGGGATCDGHHPFIRLRDTGGAHSTRLKGDAHLQGCAAGACSTCHDGLLAPVARARQGATPWAAVPRETHPHTWGAVVCVECSSSTLPKSWQLCRKCSEPLLANIYLHEMDMYMESNYLHLPYHVREKRRRQGKGNYLSVRYADDWVVLCNGTKADAQGMQEELGGLLSHMGLTLSEEKTKLTHLTEGFEFLGYRIIREVGTNGKMVPKVLIPDSAMTKYRHKVRRALAPNTHKESVTVKILALNRLTNGWCQYYRVTSSPGRMFSKLSHELFQEMAHWLGRKFEIRMPEVMRRYRKENTFGINSARLVRPFEHKAKRLLTKTWHNPYTAKEATIREQLLVYESIWIGESNRHGRMDLREEVIARKGTMCAINGP